MRTRKTISFAVFCFNEEENVIPCYTALRNEIKKLKQYDYEFVFADNASGDHTRTKIRQLAAKDPRVKGVFLSRNFGPESSGQAAMDYASGEAVIPYECDMQDPPSAVPQLITKWEEGYDVVIGIRTQIEDNLLMTFLRKAYYKVFKAVSHIDVPVNAGTFCLMSRKAVDALKSMPEKYRFYRGLRAWLGFRTAYVPYHRRRRQHGKSSYNLFGYLQHAQRSFFGFSYFLLSFMVYAGFALTGLSFILVIGYFWFHVITKTSMDPTTLLLLAITFFGGIQLLAISIIGKYIQVVVEETKNRPLYVVDQVINIQKKTRRT